MSVNIKFDSVQRANLALHQNYVPIIRFIEIDNTGDTGYEDLLLKVTSDPGQLAIAEIPVTSLRASENLVLKELKIRHSWSFFKSVQERIVGNIIVELFDNRGERISSAVGEITIEPDNVWLGQASPLELLCAHIMPNGDSIQGIIRMAADLLNEQTGNSALDGYQANDPKRVDKVAQAIFRVLRDKNISYAVAPASFEKHGQKIRRPNQIIKQGIGNCLDLSLLFAACLEQVGIHGLVFIIEGHAFVGFWLEDKFMPRAVDEDPQFFRKRLELAEMVVLDITGVASDQLISFSELEKRARAYFDNEDKFEAGIDVTYCRKNRRVLPLNDLGEQDGVVHTERSLREEVSAFESRSFNTFEMPTNVASRAAEVEKWKEKLLDLSFRNKLLNFKNQRNTVEILCHNPAEIEDILADGSEFEILSEPKENELSRQRLDFQEIQAEQITNHFQKKKLLSRIKENKFISTLTGLYRSAVNAEEETGANTLFLALGILSWTEIDGSEQIRRSPLLLLPVHLKRKYVGGRFFLSLRGDETVINYTLLQKLKKDFNFEFPGLDPLPQDDSGVDVKQIFNIIRKVIRDKRGWEVKEEVWLSEFSFQKFLMWKELDEHYDKMLESPIIRRIMTSEVPESTTDFITEGEVESKSHPKETFCPLSADSSQMAAILSAANGKSFVLQGPPGTGKSQTIANMIAHCMAVGKRILFVSEKKVALEVVYRRLKEIGIEQFCLELHSKKSEKKEVVNSFFESLEYRSDSLDQQWNRASEGLLSSRNDLNQYFQLLHDKSSIGISAYEAFGKSRRSKNYPGIKLDFESVLDFPEAKKLDLTIRLDKWFKQSIKLSEENFDAWSGVLQGKWSVQLEDDCSNRIEQILEEIKYIKEAIKAAPAQLPVNAVWPQATWSEFAIMLRLLLDTPTITTDFLKKPDFSKYSEEFFVAIDHLKKQHELKKQIVQDLDATILSQNFKLLKAKYEETGKGMFLAKFFKRRAFKKHIKDFTKSEKNDLSLYLPLLVAGVEFQGGLDKQEKAEVLVKDCIGESYELALDGSFRESMMWALKLQNVISSLYSTDLILIADCKKIISGIIENRSIVLNNRSAIQKEMERVLSLLGVFSQNIEGLKNDLLLGFDCDLMSIESLEKKFTLLMKSFSSFRDIASMNGLREELSKLGLEQFFFDLDQGKFSRMETMEVFDYNLHKLWLDEKTRVSDVLSKTTGNQLSGWDESYKKADQEYGKVTRRALSSKIAKDKPVLGEMVIPNTPLGVIARESKKARGHMHIRKFLDTIDPVARKLKPCYLMSPMSVSQYLPVKPDFDIVIFDEASQIPPWDAIGALSRGHQAVVVGDTKQLPPTAFFSMRSEEEEVDDEKIDCESVLEMFGSMFPEMLLKWHYRSRSESLISFSNFHVYGNRLHTFPSVETNDNKVSLKVLPFNEAFYDRGKTRTNKGEAQAVVNEVFRSLKIKNETDSIGVVTFSSAQANLISDLIDERLQTESKFESFFDVSRPDYVFVKNLENVQGDERDTILFSVGYGKDFSGRLSKNFGPLNNSGGERRLNVAITRARKEVKIFCNFHPRDFDISSSGAEGIRLLKEYLLYASAGKNVLRKSHSLNSNDDFDSPFEQEVTEELRKRGWKVHSQVGVGGYRIDLGVVHPDHPGKFLAGLECDGARYHSAKSARDRDILRQAVLEGLGWSILRIWSTDWWYDSNGCLDNIETKLKTLLALNNENPHMGEPAEQQDHEELTGETVGELSETIRTEPDIPRYNLSHLNLKVSGEFFDKPWLIKEQIKHVVGELGPISKEECFSIIRKAWGFARAGNRIETYLTSCIKDIHKTKTGERMFFWKERDQVNTINQLRLPVEGEQRHPLSIAPEELAFGIQDVIKANITATREDLLKQVARILGFSRISKENIDAMASALDILLRANLVKNENDTITYLL